MNKHQLLSERDLDSLHDHLSELNEETARFKISEESPITPDLVFGLDTKLFTRQNEEGLDWEAIAGSGPSAGAGAGAGGGTGSATENWHGDEVETKSIWRGGKRPGSGSTKSTEQGKDKDKDQGKGKGKGDGPSFDHAHHHGDGCGCDPTKATGSNAKEEAGEISGKVEPISREVLDAALSNLSFEIYRGESNSPLRSRDSLAY